MAVRRYPVEPLIEWCVRNHQVVNFDSGQRSQLGEVGITADRLGVATNSVRHWQRYELTWLSADASAIRLGVHPCAIWHDWLSDEIEQASAA